METVGAFLVYKALRPNQLPHAGPSAATIFLRYSSRMYILGYFFWEGGGGAGFQKKARGYLRYY